MRLFFAFFIAVTLLFPTSVVNAQSNNNDTYCFDQVKLELYLKKEATCSAYGNGFGDVYLPPATRGLCYWKAIPAYQEISIDTNGKFYCKNSDKGDLGKDAVQVIAKNMGGVSPTPTPTKPGATPTPGGGGNQPAGCNPKTYTGRIVTFERLKALVSAYPPSEVIPLINESGVDFKPTGAQKTELQSLGADSSIISAVESNLKCTTIAPSPTPTKGGGGGGTKPTPTKPGSGGGGGSDNDGFKPGEPPPGKVQGRCEEGFHEDGVLCIPNPVVKGPDSVQSLAAKLISYLLYLSGIIAVIMIIIGGYQIMTAAGDASQAASGRKTLTNAVIGLVIIVLSYTIIKVVIGFVT